MKNNKGPGDIKQTMYFLFNTIASYLLKITQLELYTLYTFIYMMTYIYIYIYGKAERVQAMWRFHYSQSSETDINQ